jgi:N-acetylglucosaminyl-diphospho-decaprenol L-rhamnosyltransferase
LAIDVSIIIVSWNVTDLLAACLDSIKPDGLNVEIIVVDSASSDNAVEMVQSRYPHVKLLAQSENVGFTRGNNIGLKVAQGRYLLLLNPDTEVIGDALSKMVGYMDSHPQVGIVGPHTLNTDGSTQSTKRRFPTFALGFFESTWLQSYAPKSMLDKFYTFDVADTAVAEVDWVQGSCLMARREVYTQIGGLDEDYVMFSEELDWCKRAKDAGWQVVYLGDAQIIHHGGKSTEQATARKHIHFQTSKLRYYRKYHGVGAAFALRVFLLMSYGSQILFEGAKSIIGYKRALRNERIRAYWQVLRSGLKVN